MRRRRPLEARGSAGQRTVTELLPLLPLLLLSAALSVSPRGVTAQLGATTLPQTVAAAAAAVEAAAGPPDFLGAAIAPVAAPSTAAATAEAVASTTTGLEALLAAPTAVAPAASAATVGAGTIAPPVSAAAPPPQVLPPPPPPLPPSRPPPPRPPPPPPPADDDNSGPSITLGGNRYTKPTTAVDSPDVILIRPPKERPRPPRAPRSAFISVRGTQFIEEGRPFYFVGFNAHWLPNLATFEHEWGRTQAALFMQSAQTLGMRVGRWWAFNKGLPIRPGEYDEDQFLGLDYTIYLASKFGIRLILAMTNLWPQYKGPEHFLYMATGSAEGKTVYDYYYDRPTREAVKRHMDVIVNRINAYSGVRYRDDPTILGWDVMNEPRCPGCDESQMAIKLGWLREMAAYLRSIDPNHLITQGSEGYFMPDPQTNLHLLNPGAGAQCEGEDWIATVSMKEHDFGCIHVYERQVEALPFNLDPNRNDPIWVKCDFVCYINWITRYIEAHEQVSEQLGKPLLLEEYGLTWWRMWEYDRRVLLQVTFEMLINSAKRNGPLAGVMFWNAAANFTGDTDGYNIYLQRPAKSISKPAPFDYGPATGSLIPGPNPITIGLSADAASGKPTRKAAARRHRSRALLGRQAAAPEPEAELLPHTFGNLSRTAANWPREQTETAADHSAAPRQQRQVGQKPQTQGHQQEKQRQAHAQQRQLQEEQQGQGQGQQEQQQGQQQGQGQEQPRKGVDFLVISELPDELHPEMMDLLLNGHLGRPTGQQQGEQQQPTQQEGEPKEGAAASGQPGAGAEAEAEADGEGHMTPSSVRRRRLHEQMVELDGFRRAWQRNDCAVRNSRVWRPPPIPTHVNYQAYRDYVEGLDAVDLIRWAGRQLNRMG